MKIKNLVFHAIILCTILGTAWLGVWQLQRREWKHTTLARLEKSYQSLKDYRSPNYNLQPLDKINPETLAYTISWVSAACSPPDFLLQPGKYLDGKAGYYLYCNSSNLSQQNPYVELKGHLLILLGWVPESFKLKDLKFSQWGVYTGALLVPFTPQPWWMPKSTDPHEIMWPFPPPAPAYPFYAVLKSSHNHGLSGTVIDIGDKMESGLLIDNHLQYAITWFTLAVVLLALYIYRQWLQKPPAKK